MKVSEQEIPEAQPVQGPWSEVRIYMDENGINYPMDHWLTLRAYAAKYRLLDKTGKPDSSLVINKIKRGNIPPDAVIEIVELGNILLVRDRGTPY